MELVLLLLFLLRLLVLRLLLRLRLRLRRRRRRRRRRLGTACHDCSVHSMERGRGKLGSWSDVGYEVDGHEGDCEKESDAGSDGTDIIKLAKPSPPSQEVE
jgi:hypothetical protein